MRTTEGESFPPLENNTDRTETIFYLIIIPLLSCAAGGAIVWIVGKVMGWCE